MPIKLERLFKLLDFYKSGFIQLSDIHRIVDSSNPYKTMTSISSSKFSDDSTFSWKANAIQQIGLTISWKYKSLSDSFEKISNGMGKIDFEQFKSFLEKQNAV